jgi:hypothetical protein
MERGLGERGDMPSERLYEIFLDDSFQWMQVANRIPSTLSRPTRLTALMNIAKTNKENCVKHTVEVTYSAFL